jgi:hypothetical protein
MDFKAVSFLHGLRDHSLRPDFLMTSRAQEFGLPQSSNPLLCPGLLQNVLGPGHCLFIAPVSKHWKDIYGAVERQRLAFYDEHKLKSIRITCVPQMTLFSSVFASSSRVQMAHRTGLDCSSQAH